MEIDYYFPAMYVLAMALGAVSSKALALVVAFCLGLGAVYPDKTLAGFLALFLFPLYVLAHFRD